MKKSVRSFVPSLATLGNLCAGVLAVLMALEGREELGALLIVAAMLLDSVDGALARAFDACSPFGAELDSLADMVSFGVAPGVLVVSLLPAEMRVFGWIGVTCFSMCAALRLARYNVQHAEPEREGGPGFSGLPTTGAGGCLAGAVLAQVLLAEHGFMFDIALLPWLALVLAALMVSPVHYPHMGSIISRLPTRLSVVLAAFIGGAAIYWEYEAIFFSFFLLYVFSGPALVVHQKVRAYRKAHFG